MVGPGAGAPTVEVGVDESSAGSYRTPVLSGPENDVPPQPMSRLPVQIVLMPGPCGGADDGGGSQVLVAGSKRYVFPDLWLDPRRTPGPGSPSTPRYGGTVSEVRTTLTPGSESSYPLQGRTSLPSQAGSCHPMSRPRRPFGSRSRRRAERNEDSESRSLRRSAKCRGRDRTVPAGPGPPCCRLPVLPRRSSRNRSIRPRRCSGAWRPRERGRRPGVRDRIVPTPRVHVSGPVDASPDDEDICRPDDRIGVTG